MKNTRDVVATGMRKVGTYLPAMLLNKLHHFAQWPGRIFKIPTPTGWSAVITDATLVADIRRAPEHILSINKFFEKVWNFQFVIPLHSESSCPTVPAHKIHV
jgi:hypothetical protein